VRLNPRLAALVQTKVLAQLLTCPFAGQPGPLYPSRRGHKVGLTRSLQELHGFCVNYGLGVEPLG